MAHDGGGGWRLRGGATSEGGAARGWVREEGGVADGEQGRGELEGGPARAGRGRHGGDGCDEGGKAGLGLGLVMVTLLGVVGSLIDGGTTLGVS